MNIVRLYDTQIDLSEHLGGVGLKFEGFPTDIKKFYEILASDGCHPKATHRILQRLSKYQFDLLTVMRGLKFAKVSVDLYCIGVKMTFIEAKEDWKPLYNDGEWPNWALPSLLQK